MQTGLIAFHNFLGPWQSAVCKLFRDSLAKRGFVEFETYWGPCASYALSPWILNNVECFLIESPVRIIRIHSPKLIAGESEGGAEAAVPALQLFSCAQHEQFFECFSYFLTSCSGLSCGLLWLQRLFSPVRHQATAPNRHLIDSTRKLRKRHKRPSLHASRATWGNCIVRWCQVELVCKIVTYSLDLLEKAKDQSRSMRHFAQSVQTAEQYDPAIPIYVSVRFECPSLQCSKGMVNMMAFFDSNALRAVFPSQVTSALQADGNVSRHSRCIRGSRCGNHLISLRGTIHPAPWRGWTSFSCREL